MTRHQIWVLVLTGVPALMVSLDILSLTTALPVIRAELGTSVAALEWSVTAYNLVFAIALMPFSALGDRLGRRRSFAAGVAAFTLGSLGCAVSGSAGMLITARAVQGLGAAMVVPLGLALVVSVFPVAHRGRALGIAAIGTGLATLSGPVLGAVITEFLGWQWIFWVNVPLGLAVLPLVLRKVPESTASPEPVDLIGLGLLSGIVLATVLATTPSLSSAPTIACIGVAALGVLSLVRWERRHPNAIIPTDFLHDRDLVAGNIASLLHSASILGSVFWMAQLFHDGLGYSTVTTGLALLPWTGTFPIVAPLAGRLIDRIGSRPVLVGGLLLQALGLAWIGIVVTSSTAYAALIVPLLLAGIGGSAVFPAAQTTVLASVPETRIGRAAGLNAVAREFGGVLGIGVVSAVFVAVGDYTSPDHVVAGIQGVLLVGASLALVGALTATTTLRHQQPPSPQRPAQQPLRT